MSKQYWNIFHLAKKTLKNWHNGVVIGAYKLIICAEFWSKDTTEVVVAKMLKSVLMQFW